MKMDKLTKEELINELQKKIKENKEISKNLERTNNKLKESESFKSNFISNVANEILNPFASILGLSKNITESENKEFCRIKNMSDLIYSEAFDLDFQLKNIFAAAKIESGEIEPEIMRVDISKLILNIIDTYKFKTEQKLLSIIFDYDNNLKLKNGFLFKTDSEKIQLIISNLLNNSIKYSNAANKIEICLFLKNNNLNIIVKDNGIGINNKNLEIIFDRFQRINTSINSINKGYGLGLSVTKALINILNGEINVKSKLNSGTSFTISIPEASATKIDGISVDDSEFFFNNDKEVF